LLIRTSKRRGRWSVIVAQTGSARVWVRVGTMPL
jgi:hypothetical protein